MRYWQPIQDSPLRLIKADTERDNFMSADEAKAYGLIDEVISKPLMAL